MRNMGEYLKDAKYAVEDAINTGNYRELSNRLGDLAGDAIHELNRSSGTFCGKKDNGDSEEPPFPGEEDRYRQNSRSWDPGWSDNIYRNRARQMRDLYRKQRDEENLDVPRDCLGRKIRIKGRVSSVMYSVFGWIGTLGFGSTAFTLFCVYLGTRRSVLKLLTEIFFVVTVASLIMLRRGTQQRRFVNRYKIYNALLKKSQFCEIKRMAEYVNKSPSFVAKELQKMMTYHMFMEAHFDDKRTVFMLGDEKYRQYVEAEKNFEARQVEQEKQKKEHEDKVVNEELEKAIREGKTYILQLRQANDDIPGEEISRKLEKLERIISKIFVCVEKHPEKLSEIRKFMDYYLPITIKLVNAYKEFDVQTIQGETVEKSKNEIENTLDTIDLAFEKLLDSLYEDEVMEVSSDISVLNALFAQEGLTKDDFNLNK